MRLAGLGLLLAPGPVFAHSPIPGIGSFYNGLLHPLLVPAHLLVLLALGLLLSQRGLGTMRLAIPAFVPALLAGLAWSFAPPSWAGEMVLLALAGLCGVLVLLQAPLPRFAAVLLSGLIGVLLGLDSAADPTFGAPLGTLAGTACGAILGLLYIAGLSERLQRPWHAIGRRILGSWICASALLVLTLSQHTGPASAGNSPAAAAQSAP